MHVYTTKRDRDSDTRSNIRLLLLSFQVIHWHRYPRDSNFPPVTKIATLTQGIAPRCSEGVGGFRIVTTGTWTALTTPRGRTTRSCRGRLSTCLKGLRAQRWWCSASQLQLRSRFKIMSVNIFVFVWYIIVCISFKVLITTGIRHPKTPIDAITETNTLYGYNKRNVT